MKLYKASLRWLSQIVFILTLVLSVACLPAFFTDPMPVHYLTVGYSIVVYMAQNFLFSCLLGLILLPIFVYVKTDWLRAGLTLILLVSFLMFFVISAKVFSFWRFYVNAPIFNLFFAKGGRGNVFQISQEMYVSLILAGLVFIALSFLVLFIAKKIESRAPVKSAWIFFTCLYVLAQSTTIFFVKNQNVQYLQYVFKSPYFMTLSWANILDVAGLPIFSKNQLGGELRVVLSKHGALHYPIHDLKFQQPSKPLNVLLIVLDSLRFDMVNSKNMPNVDAFSKHSDRFLNHISGGDCTRAGIFSLFYGIPATYWDSVISHHQGSIVIRAFQKAHYQFALFGSAGFLSPPFNQTVFASVKHLTLTVPGDSAWVRDKAITKKIAHFFDQQENKKRPFFGFLFYDSPHAYNALDFQKPFTPVLPMNYFTVNNHTNPLPIFNMYQNAVFAVDQLVGEVLSRLQSDGLSNNTVVIITSDHGQEFNEYHNNYWEHPSGFSQYQLRTPLIIAWPGHSPREYPYLTTHFDLAPTLLKGVLGVKNPASDYSVGHDLYKPHGVLQAVIGRYGYYGLVTKDIVMPFQSSGIYRFTDNKMNPLPIQHLDGNVKTAMLKSLWQFY